MTQNMGIVSVPVSELTHSLTLKITGLGGFRARLKIAPALIWLACRIAGIGVQFEKSI